ncbi:MAG: hypothetical protein KKA79_08625 [Nanoarchaeota archaeon]|nr:hypothetical protein [Nanoarchaeota archaeon]MCG2719045.1 hypothetical protein [Nanoarchaeota archaeon]
MKIDEDVSKNLKEIVEVAGKFSVGGGYASFTSSNTISIGNRAKGRELNLESPVGTYTVKLDYKRYYFFGDTESFDLFLYFDDRGLCEVEACVNPRKDGDYIHESYDSQGIVDVINSEPSDDLERKLKKELGRGICSARKIIKKQLSI